MTYEYCERGISTTLLHQREAASGASEELIAGHCGHTLKGSVGHRAMGDLLVKAGA